MKRLVPWRALGRPPPVDEEAEEAVGAGADDASVDSDLLSRGSRNSSDDPEHGRRVPVVGAIWEWGAEQVRRRQAVSALLTSIRTGDTNGVLDALCTNVRVLAEFRGRADGNTVWHLLAEFGDASQLQALVNFVRIHAKTITIPFKKAKKRVQPGDSDSMITALINQGNKLQQTPLMFAAYHGREETVKLLIQLGSNPWAYDRCGRRTALHYACRKGHAHCVRALLDNIPQAQQTSKDGIRYVDVRTGSGYTPLHFAAAADSVPCVRTLLAYGATLHFYNYYSADDFWINCVPGTTALHLAALLGHENIALALMRHYLDHKASKAAEPEAAGDTTPAEQAPGAPGSEMLQDCTGEISVRGGLHQGGGGACSQLEGTSCASQQVWGSSAGQQLPSIPGSPAAAPAAAATVGILPAPYMQLDHQTAGTEGKVEDVSSAAAQGLQQGSPAGPLLPGILQWQPPPIPSVPLPLHPLRTLGGSSDFGDSRSSSLPVALGDGESGAAWDKGPLAISPVAVAMSTGNAVSPAAGAQGDHLQGVLQQAEGQCGDSGLRADSAALVCEQVEGGANISGDVVTDLPSLPSLSLKVLYPKDGPVMAVPSLLQPSSSFNSRLTAGGDTVAAASPTASPPPMCLGSVTHTASGDHSQQQLGRHTDSALAGASVDTTQFMTPGQGPSDASLVTAPSMLQGLDSGHGTLVGRDDSIATSSILVQLQASTPQGVIPVDPAFAPQVPSVSAWHPSTELSKHNTGVLGTGPPAAGGGTGSSSAGAQDEAAAAGGVSPPALGPQQGQTCMSGPVGERVSEPRTSHSGGGPQCHTGTGAPAASAGAGVARGSAGSGLQKPSLATQDSGRLEKSGPSSRLGRPSTASAQGGKPSFMRASMRSASSFLRGSRPTSSGASTSRPTPASLSDPRLWLDSRRRTPFQVAREAGFEDLSLKLHPRADLESMWTPQDLAKYANSGTVKPLAVIVAHVLEAKLMGSIQEAVDCMKLLGTYQQTGRVFGRTGRYEDDDAGMGLGYNMGLEGPMGPAADDRMTYGYTPARNKGGDGAAAPPAPPKPIDVMMANALAASGLELPADWNPPALGPGQPGAGAYGGLNLSSAAQFLATAGSAEPFNKSRSGQEQGPARGSGAAAGNMQRASEGDAARLAPRPSKDDELPPARQSLPYPPDLPFVSGASGDLFTGIGAYSAGASGPLPRHLAGSVASTSGGPGMDQNYPGSIAGRSGDSLTQRRGSALQLAGASSGGGFGWPSTPGTPDRGAGTGDRGHAGRSRFTILGTGPHAHAAMLYTAPSSKLDAPPVVGITLVRAATAVALEAAIQAAGTGGASPVASTQHVDEPPCYNQSLAAKSKGLLRLASTDVPGLGSLAGAASSNPVFAQASRQSGHSSGSRNAEQSLKTSVSAGVSTQGGSPAGGSLGGASPAGASRGSLSTRNISTVSTGVIPAPHSHQVLEPNINKALLANPAAWGPLDRLAAIRGSSAEEVARKPNLAVSSIKAWFGYERAYDAKRGATVGQGGQEASALRRYETTLEAKRTLHEGHHAQQRLLLCGVIPLPNCNCNCLKGNKHDKKDLPLRPGVDVCGVCMDNKPLLEMRSCRHRICIMCAKSRCHLLELRELVTCPFCAAIVLEFVLASFLLTHLLTKKIQRLCLVCRHRME